MNDMTQSRWITITSVAWLFFSIPAITLLLSVSTYDLPGSRFSLIDSLKKALIFASPGVAASFLRLLPITSLVRGWKYFVTRIFLLVEVLFYALIVLASIALLVWFALSRQSSVPSAIFSFAILFLCSIIVAMTVVPSMMTRSRMRAIRKEAQQIVAANRRQVGSG